MREPPGSRGDLPSHPNKIRIISITNFNSSLTVSPTTLHLAVAYDNTAGCWACLFTGNSNYHYDGQTSDVYVLEPFQLDPSTQELV